jgi:hypothetical protein
MNRLDRARIVRHANHLLTLWKEMETRAHGDPWAFREYRQAYRDALTSLKACNLIVDYDFDKGVTYPTKEEK